MNGLEHKDERLHAVAGADWRDKLAEIRAELPHEPETEPSEDPDRDPGPDDPRR